LFFENLYAELGVRGQRGKGKMKRILIGICCILGFLASNKNCSAIEGLKISVQGSNVVLSWPSTNIETYLVRYRPDLSTNSTWTNLADFYPASSSNITFFVQSNIVQYPLVFGGGTNDGGGSPPSPDSDTTSGPSVPMVMSTNGTGEAAPLAIYPPGFNLTGFIIFDPATGEWISGNGYVVSPTSSTQAGGAQPLDDSGTNSTSDPGFYEVVQDGIQIFGLTNGAVLSGVVQYPIEMAWTNNSDQVVGISFYDANTNPIIGAYAQSSGSNGWQMVWNTPVSLNGNYSVYAELDFASNNPVVSNPVSVTVNNVISFPNYFTQTFGNQMWIYAQTITNTAFQIDMYDENTNYLGSFTGAADGNGVISFLWDLGGLTSTNFYGVFTVDTSSLASMSSGGSAQSLSTRSSQFQSSSLAHKTLAYKIGVNGVIQDAGSSSASANQLWQKESKWTPNNNWVVAYGLFNSSTSLQLADEEMIQGGEDGSELGVLWTLDPYGTVGNLSPGNYPTKPAQSAVYTVQDASTASALLGYLASHTYENFYFFGHGNSSIIGSYNGFGLTQEQIADALVNVPLSYRVFHAAEHPYRFVMLDGCDTGAATFSEAFAIPAMVSSTNFFAAGGVESRAFIGFKSWKVADITISNWENYSQMTGHFLTDWLSSSYNLQTCVSNAVLNVYHIGANMDSSVVIDGAADMYSSVHTGQ
jgi:hypothetical protein